jgi:3-hydroxyisobutyrate dehydrogenase
MTTVAILGTGKMGGAIARRLAASDFNVTLWNRTPDKAEALHLGRVAATPADAARDAHVIISSLTNEAAIRDVYLGEHGVLQSAAGKLLIEMSTAGPEVVEELGREAEAQGAHLLEAPVVGSVPAVESGKLLILVAGERADLETALPVIERLGEVSYVGQRGNAQRLKLIANSMLGITSTAAAELLAAGAALSSSLRRSSPSWFASRPVWVFANADSSMTSTRRRCSRCVISSRTSTLDCGPMATPVSPRL